MGLAITLRTGDPRGLSTFAPCYSLSFPVAYGLMRSFIELVLKPLWWPLYWDSYWYSRFPGANASDTLRQTGLFDDMARKTDEGEHSLEMHLPFLLSVMHGQVRVRVRVRVNP